jgi:hypothetical protein
LTQAPELLKEWREVDSPIKRAVARQHLTNHGVYAPLHATVVSIGQLTVRQLNLFAHKAVLALYFEHFRCPLSAEGAFCAFWKRREDYAVGGVPSDLLKMLPKYATLVQGRWDTREVFEYRHAINVDEGLFGFFARLRRGLFVSGFAVRSAADLPDASGDWVRPGDLLSLLGSPRFLKKL